MEMTSLADLLDVQDLDLQIDRLLARRQSLPELDAYKGAHEREQELTTEIQTAAGELKTLELEFDKSEGELQILEAKLTEHETRLFAGGMRASETEHMRLEVQSLHGQQEALEERVLAMLERLDPAREQMADLEARRDAVTQEKAGYEDAIKSEWKLIDAELARKEEHRAWLEVVHFTDKLAARLARRGELSPDARWDFSHSYPRTAERITRLLIREYELHAHGTDLVDDIE